MLPTIAWDGDDIVMIDQRKLPGREVYVRCRSGDEVAKAITTMVIRGAPAIGVAAAMGLALGAQRSTATGTRQFVTEFQRLADAAGRHPADRREPVLGDRADEAGVRGRRPAGESVGELTLRLRREAERIHDEDVASCRAIGRHGAGAAARRRARAHPLQRRRARHRRLRHGARRDPRRGRGGQDGRRARRRDPAVPAGRAAHRLGAGQGRHRHDGDHRQHGRRRDGGRARRRGRRRRRPHRRQRRHRQQDRHLRRGVLAQRARHPVLRRRADVHHRPGTADRRRHPDRGAQRRRSHAHRRHPARARRRVGAQPGLRRHAAPLRHRASSPSAASSHPPFAEGLARLA